VQTLVIVDGNEWPSVLDIFYCHVIFCGYAYYERLARNCFVYNNIRREAPENILLFNMAGQAFFCFCSGVWGWRLPPLPVDPPPERSSAKGALRGAEGVRCREDRVTSPRNFFTFDLDIMHFGAFCGIKIETLCVKY
jgi:hypothetical protein